MKTHKILIGISLLLALNACAAPPDADLSAQTDSETAPTISEPNLSAEPDATQTKTGKSSTERADSPKEMRNCASASYPSTPLSRKDNTHIFDQFNFRPNDITIFADTIAVKTKNYTFYYCEPGKDWVALANEAESEPSDGYDLKKIAGPAYESIEVDGKAYEYRTRLKADWLTNRIATVETAPNKTAESGEDVVYFDLKLPDGTEINRELYTLSNLQAANLGASLGVPEVAGVDVTDDGIWFAATASQGEGDNGFASVLRYNLETETLTVEQPETLQGDQITDLAATEQDGKTTLWLGTQRSGEGVPFFPSSGLVAYQPGNDELKNFTITNSPIVGAIPSALAVEKDWLWVATGDGTCRVKWQQIEDSKRWDCWRLEMTAKLPKGGIDLYPSFLSTQAKAKLTKPEVEVLWGAASRNGSGGGPDAIEVARYEVVYEPGFEAVLSQGGYRVADAAAKRATRGEPIFWLGRQWHWAGDRFRRGLDEVSLNFFGGGPYGLVTSAPRNNLRFDHSAIRGAFDLLELTPESTKVRYYSGWVNADELEVYPRLKPIMPPRKTKPNPLTKMADDLPNSGP